MYYVKYIMIKRWISSQFYCLSLWENVKHFWQNNLLMPRKYYVMLSHLLSGINATMYHKVLKCPIVKDCYGNGLMHIT